MKIIVGIILLVASSYVGYIYSKKYKMREQFFNSSMQFISSIQPKISFFKKPLKQILSEEIPIYDSEFSAFLSQALDVYINNDMASFSDFDKALQCKFLTENERSYFVSLFSILGKTEVKEQNAALEEYKKGIDKMHDLALQEKTKFSVMYQKLGVLCGIGLFVVAI